MVRHSDFSSTPPPPPGHSASVGLRDRQVEAHGAVEARRPPVVQRMHGVFGSVFQAGQPLYPRGRLAEQRVQAVRRGNLQVYGSGVLEQTGLLRGFQPQRQLFRCGERGRPSQGPHHAGGEVILESVEVLESVGGGASA